MKTSKIILTSIMSLFVLFCFSDATAQNSPNPKGSQVNPEKKGPQKKFSKEDFQTMKIAFFTNELDLTPEEAEKFWPVYRECEKRVMEARRATQKIQKELTAAIADSNKSDLDIKQLVDSYYAALEKENRISKENFTNYQKVLPLKKASKVRLTDEKFYHHLVGKLKPAPAPAHKNNAK